MVPSGNGLRRQVHLDDRARPSTSCPLRKLHRRRGRRYASSVGPRTASLKEARCGLTCGLGWVRDMTAVLPFLVECVLYPEMQSLHPPQAGDISHARLRHAPHQNRNPADIMRGLMELQHHGQAHGSGCSPRPGPAHAVHVSASSKRLAAPEPRGWGQCRDRQAPTPAAAH